MLAVSSATLPKDVLSVAQFATRDAQLIDTVGDDDEQTNVHVNQAVTVTPLQAQAAELLHLLRQLQRGGGGQQPAYKVPTSATATSA